MEVFFCDRCSTRVTEGDLADGRAVRVHTFVLCKGCWENSEVRAAIEQKVAEDTAAGRATPGRQRRTPSGTHRAHRPRTPRSTPAVRRSPARGLPRAGTPPPQGQGRTPSGRTPVPQGHRRTPGRNSPVHLERVQHHSGAHHHRPNGDSGSVLAKVTAFTIVGLVVGVTAVFFAGPTKDPGPRRSNGDGAAGIEEDASGRTAMNGGGGVGARGAGGRDDDNDVMDELYLRPDEAAGAESGLRYDLYEGDWQWLPDYGTMAPAETGTATTFGKVGGRDAHYGIRFSGYIDAPADGRYTFHVASDDGVRFWIGGRPVVQHDGIHAAEERVGNVYLRAGKHRVRLDYFQKDGDEHLAVSWTGPGIEKGSVPEGALFHRGG